MIQVEQTLHREFKVAETRDNKGILGSNFPVQDALTVRPHEFGVYLPTWNRREDDLNWWLPCVGVTASAQVVPDFLVLQAGPGNIE